MAATTSPPTAGPEQRARTPGGRAGRASWPATRWCGATISGTSAPKAGPKKASPAPVEHGERDEVPDLEHAGERQHARHDQHRRAHEVGGDQHPAALHAVADDPAREQERDHAARPRQADERQRDRVVVDVVDLPRLGHDEDAVAEQRDGHAGPQQREVALAQGPQQLHVSYRGSRHARRHRRSRGGRQVDRRPRRRAGARLHLPGLRGALPRRGAVRRPRSGVRCDIRFDGDRVLLDGEDVSEAIRTPEISAGGLAARRRPGRARRPARQAARAHRRRRLGGRGPRHRHRRRARRRAQGVADGRRGRARPAPRRARRRGPRARRARRGPRALADGRGAATPSRSTPPAWASTRSWRASWTLVGARTP